MTPGGGVGRAEGAGRASGRPSYDGRVRDPRLPAPALTRLGHAVFQPAYPSLRRLAAASVVLNVVIVVSGATVRLTESGLGCPDWPRCTGDSLVPVRGAGDSTLHMAIEFGNRLIALPVLATALACLVAALRLRAGRRDLTMLAFLQVLGIVMQAVVGGITVYAGLNPVSVATHFVLSMGVIAAAVALHARATDEEPTRPAAPPILRTLAVALAAAALLVLVLGTVVTGSGPHAGDAAAPRLPFSIEAVAKIHSGAAWLTLALTVAVIGTAHAVHASDTLRRRARELLVLVLAQGAVGYIQYFTGIPAPLVAVHVLGAALIWIATLRVLLATRDPAPHIRRRDLRALGGDAPHDGAARAIG